MATELVNEKTMRVAGWIMRSLILQHNNQETKIKSDDMVKAIRNGGYRMDGAELREIIGHIRRNDLCRPGFIVSDNGGYWYTEKVEEMEKAWQTEFNRARNILKNFNPLRRRVKHLISEKTAMI